MMTTDVLPPARRRPIAGLLAIASVSVAALAVDADRSSARGAAWCLVGGDSGRSCGYYTFEQCLASRAGGSSHCEPNPNDPANQRDASRPARRAPRR